VNTEKVVWFNGFKFVREDKTGYYQSSKPIKDGKRVRLHRYKWEYFNGPIPEGHIIHHIDCNRDNNDITNLLAVIDPKHRSYHSGIDKNKPEWLKTWEEIRQKGSDAHKRPEEREKQAERSKQQWAERKQGDPRIMTCQECGNNYETYHTGESMFCSKKCKQRDFRRRFREEHGYGYDAKIRRGRRKGKAG